MPRPRIATEYNNQKRFDELRARVRRPKYALGETIIEPNGELGVITAIYADMEAMHDAGVTGGRDWYAIQRKRPKTPQDGIWYSVITVDGGVLVGEDDVRPVL